LERAVETALLNEIINCLPDDRTLFRYALGEYAPILLSKYAGTGMRIADIKRSVYRGLLEKPAVKQLIANCGKGKLTNRDFECIEISDRQNFVLTVGTWDRDRKYFSQTTRNSGNLVLHLNFSKGHDRQFHHLIGDQEFSYFKYNEHPILQCGERSYYRNTLGWARIDLDFDSGEVLIEEIQNDWLRRASRYQKRMIRYISRHPDYQKALRIHSTIESIEHYMQQVLYPYCKMWDEAILAATIQFCIEELGIRQIYYHSFDTGNKLKKIKYGHPPRSLYTNLPKRFCFTLTDSIPLFLTRSKVVKRKLKKVKNPRWFELLL
jgi:hypothetical protein